MTTIAPTNCQNIFQNQSEVAAFSESNENGGVRVDMSESQENPNATFVPQVCPVVLSHEDNQMQPKNVDEVSSHQDGGFACPCCHKLFNSETNLQLHLEEHRAKCDDTTIVRLDLSNAQVSPVTTYVQQMCPVIIGSQETQMQPDTLGDVKLSARPDGRFACPYCHKLYFSENNLRAHLDVHRGVRRFQCEFCGKGYAKSFLLKSHIKSVHENIRDVTCTICQKAFSKRSVMRRHMKSVHAEKKDFHCTQCHKQFTEKKNLQMHINALHKGLRPHRCTSCMKEFARKCDLLRHANSVHRECKPYTCPLCNKGFPQKWYFERHLASVHKAMLSSRTQPMQSQSQAVQQLQHVQTSQLSTQQQPQHTQPTQLPSQPPPQQQPQPHTSHSGLVSHPPPPPQQQQQQQQHHHQQQHHFAFFQPQGPNQAMNLPMGAIIAGPGTPAMPSGTQVMMVAPGMNMPVPAFFFQPQQNPSFQTQHNAIVHPTAVLPTVPTTLMTQQSVSGPAHFIHTPFGLPTNIPISQPAVSQSPTPASASRPTKEYQCTICSKVYPRRQSLQAHIIQVHTDKKPYECNLCHKGFVRRWDFYRHVNSVHQDNATSAIDPDKTEEYLAWMRGRRSSLDISWECLNAVRPELVRIKSEENPTSQPNTVFLQPAPHSQPQSQHLEHEHHQQQQQQQHQHLQQQAMQSQTQHQVPPQQQQHQQPPPLTHSSDADHLTQYQTQNELSSVVTSDLSAL